MVTPVWFDNRMLLRVIQFVGIRWCEHGREKMFPRNFRKVAKCNEVFQLKRQFNQPEEYSFIYHRDKFAISTGIISSKLR